MIKLSYNTVKSFSFENLFLLICIFYSSGSISFYSSPWGHALLFVMSSFFILKHNLSKKFLTALFIWTVYCTILILFYRDYILTFNHFARFSTLIIAAYALILKYGETIFFRFEKIIIVLAKISLIFWLWTIISRSSILQLGSILSIGDSANNPNRMSEFYYIFLYTIEYFSYDTTFIPRNYGFCLEPVIFSAFIVMAMFFNIMRNNGIKIKKNLNLLVLLFVLFTTQSTTGIISFMAFIIYFLYSYGKLSAIKILTLVIVCAAFVYSMIYFDFLLPKIGREYEGLSNFEKISKMSNQDMRFSAGRFGGFIIGWNDILSYPVLGIGANGMRSFANKGGASLMNTNGFAGIMSVFGLFGMVIYFYLIIRSSVFLSRVFKVQIPLGFMILFTLVLFGAGIHRAVIFFTFMIYGYLMTNSSLRSYLQKENNTIETNNNAKY